MIPRHLAKPRTEAQHQPVRMGFCFGCDGGGRVTQKYFGSLWNRPCPRCDGAGIDRGVTPVEAAFARKVWRQAMDVFERWLP